MAFFGIIYILTSTSVLLFKKETSKDESQDLSDKISLVDSYKVVWKIICLKPIHKLIFIIFTLRVS